MTTTDETIQRRAQKIIELFEYCKKAETTPDIDYVKECLTAEYERGRVAGVEQCAKWLGNHKPMMKSMSDEWVIEYGTADNWQKIVSDCLRRYLKQPAKEVI